MPPTRLAFVVVGAAAPPEALVALADRAHALFADASRGHLVVEVAMISVLPAAPGARSLDEAGFTYAAQALGAAGATADVVVLVAGDGLRVASDRCGCLAWAHAPRAGLPAVIGLATVAELGDAASSDLRLLHEVGHATCCRLGDPAVAALLADTAHWRRAAWNAQDPMAAQPGDGATRRSFHDLTLVAMGALAPEDAAPARMPDGRLLSGLDVARAR